jgi:hypothetical protein
VRGSVAVPIHHQARVVVVDKTRGGIGNKTTLQEPFARHWVADTASARGAPAWAPSMEFDAVMAVVQRGCVAL